MKIALLCYHANADKIYKPEWIKQYKESVLNQTYDDFAIMEFNYGGDTFRIFENSYFESVQMPTFVDALNYLLDKCFSSGFDFCFNSNCDDYFSLNRIEKQLPYLRAGFDIVSSNFALIQNEQVVKYHRFHELNIEEQLNNNHNVICHPVIGYSKPFWDRNRYMPDEMPIEDMLLWQRSIKNSRFIILEETLLFHRIHNNAVCRSDNR